MNFDDFIAYLKTEKRSSVHTVSSYSTDLIQFAAFCKAEFEVHSETEVTNNLVRSWIASLVEQGLKSTSIHRKLSSVKAYFKFLQKMDVVSTNPVKGIVKPKKPQRLPHYVEERNLNNLYDKHLKEESSTDFESLRNLLIVKLFYETGMRQAELLGIKDRDIDFSIGQIKILGKRNKMRYVPVGKDMLVDLSHYIRYRDEFFGVSHEGNLFVSNKGQKISKSLVYQIVKSYLSTVTTQSKKSPHVLRHSFATHMLNHGADLNVIKELLGHSSLAATQVYTHNSIEKLKGVHSKLHPRSK